MKPSLQKYFGVLRDNLSVRARHILEANKIFDFSALLKKTEKPGFSFMNLKNCGKKTADELDEFVSQLLDYKKRIIDSNVSDTENTINSITEDECFKFKTTAPIRTPITDFGLSVRTINCLKSIEVETLGDLVSYNKSELVKLRGFGKKVLLEIENIVLSYGLEFGIKKTSFHQEDVKIQNIDPIISNLLNNRYISNNDIYYSYTFKDIYGHFPMIFLSYRTSSLLKDNEREVLRLTVEPSPPLSLEEIAIELSLTHERIRQIYDKACKRIRTNGTLKQLFQHEDWRVYGIEDNTPSVFMCDMNTERIIEERDFLLDYTLKNKNTEWNSQNIMGNSLYFILLLKGMTPLWLDHVKKELVSHYITSGSEMPFLFVDGQLNQYNFNRAIRKIRRLQTVKKTDSIIIPIKSYFIDNDYYWNRNRDLNIAEKGKLKELLIRVFQVVCDIHIEGDCIVFQNNRIDYGNLLYELLKKAGSRLHRDDLLQLLTRECLGMGVSCKYNDSSQITSYLSKDSRIVPIGKSGYWELKEWGNKNGSIREIALELMQKTKSPIRIDKLCEMILKHRPDSNTNSISCVVRQAASSGELLIFYDDYVGYPQKKYVNDYVIMPQSFDDWIKAYRAFAEKNRRHPYSSQDGYEGYLYRWHYRSSQYTDLTSDEILKFDALEKELAHYPQNATEYDFLQNCNLYKKFVESNKRMLTKDDDSELFNWFYRSSRSHSTYNDNRNKYFSQLLQSLSAILY